MVEIQPVRVAIEAAILAARPDGRYALEDSAFSAAWTISPDSERELSPRDLLVSIHITGGSAAGSHIEHAVIVQVTTADYVGEKVSIGSGRSLTALDRSHGAALHLIEILAATPIPGGALTPTDYDDPRSYGEGLWLSTVVSSTLTLSRR